MSKHTDGMNRRAHGAVRVLAIAVTTTVAVLGACAFAGGTQDAGTMVAVGPQYDSTHVYLATSDFDAFVNSFMATFGGKSSPRIEGNVLPVSSRAQMQYVLTPVGTLSVFAFETPIPFPFGTERTGYLVTDMDRAISAAESAGASAIVAPFKDRDRCGDRVARGGVRMQLYWHFKSTTTAPLQTIPENRLYVPADRADDFVRDFLKFSAGKVMEDEKKADAAEIWRGGEFYRRISVSSLFGDMRVLVTDGHLPYPFGREITGYEVKNLAATLEKAKGAGAKVLAGPYAGRDRNSAIIQFPGGYIAEVHDAASPESGR